MDTNLEVLVTAATEVLRTKPAEKHPVWAFFNSSFFLTFLGGMIIAFAGVILQNKYSEAAAAAQRQQLELSAKREFLKEFTESVTYGVEYAVSMRLRELWLRKHQNDADRDQIRYGDGRSYSETRDYWEVTRERLFKQRTPLALCHTGMALFRAPPAVDSLRTIAGLYTALLECPDYAAVSTIHDEIQAKLYVSLNELGKEINETKPAKIQ